MIVYYPLWSPITPKTPYNPLFSSITLCNLLRFSITLYDPLWLSMTLCSCCPTILMLNGLLSNVLCLLHVHTWLWTLLLWTCTRKAFVKGWLSTLILLMCSMAVARVISYISLFTGQWVNHRGQKLTLYLKSDFVKHQPTTNYSRKMSLKRFQHLWRQLCSCRCATVQTVGCKIRVLLLFSFLFVFVFLLILTLNTRVRWMPDWHTHVMKNQTGHMTECEWTYGVFALQTVSFKCSQSAGLGTGQHSHQWQQHTLS